MYSKIDKNILSKIKSQKLNENLDIVVLAEDYFETKNLLKSNFDKIIELPIINSLAVSCSINDILKISKFEFVKFITVTTKVSSLMYSAREFVNAEKLSDLQASNEDHSIAIIDTGIYPHIDFCLGKNRIIKFVDLINDKTTLYDDNGHGTFVAGVLGSKSITNQYNGFDNNCNIIAIKALDIDGETTTIKILQAMQWILDNKNKYNIRVVCMSFGSIMLEYNDPLMYAAEVLWNDGIIVVSAAGNSGPQLETIMSPGTAKKIITVGSLAKNLDKIEVADFSSRGPVFNYYKPDMVLPGVDIISTNVFSKNKNFYTTMSGTSVSTPMVAGIASMLINHNPKYTPDQIKYMLIKSCVKITGDRNSEGYGYLDLSKLILL